MRRGSLPCGMRNKVVLMSVPLAWAKLSVLARGSQTLNLGKSSGPSEQSVAHPRLETGWTDALPARSNGCTEDVQRMYGECVERLEPQFRVQNWLRDRDSNPEPCG